MTRIHLQRQFALDQDYPIRIGFQSLNEPALDPDQDCPLRRILQPCQSTMGVFSRAFSSMLQPFFRTLNYHNGLSAAGDLIEPREQNKVKKGQDCSRPFSLPAVHPLILLLSE